MKRLRFFSAVLFLVPMAIAAQQTLSSPPMGWNSWDAYGLNVHEDQFRANVEAMKTKLLPFGWKYAVVDEGWFFTAPDVHSKKEMLRYTVDSEGRYVPAAVRFPSAAASGATPVSIANSSSFKLDATIENSATYAGFKPLADWVHAQGLLFGVHIVRGIPRVSVERNLPIEGSSFHAQDAADTSDACSWDPTNWGVKDNAAGQAWYDSLLRQYAAWGVDFVKVDCIANRPYKLDEIKMIRHAIDKTGRPMVLSLSPGPVALEHAQEVAGLASMWRVSNDIWDVWATAKSGKFPQDVRGQFDRAAQWAAVQLPPGRWPDLDMLPIGELRPSPNVGAPRASRLTPNEQRTMLTLWAMKQSPLVLGANLTLLDAKTLKLLTNKAWIDIDQHGVNGREVFRDGSKIAWSAQLPGGKLAVALFNLGETPIATGPFLAEFAKRMPEAKRLEYTDVWTQGPLNEHSPIPAHGCVLLESR